MIELFNGLSARQFAKLVRQLRSEGADPTLKGRPWNLTDHQVAVHADSQLVVVVGKPLPGNRNDSVAFTASGVDHATRTATVIADGGYQGTRAHIPHRHKHKDEPLGEWKEAKKGAPPAQRFPGQDLDDALSATRG